MRPDLRYIEKSNRSLSPYPVHIYPIKGPSQVSPHWHHELEILFSDCFTKVDIDMQQYFPAGGSILCINPQQLHSFSIPEGGVAYALLLDYAFLEFKQSDFSMRTMIAPLMDSRLRFPSCIQPGGDLHAPLYGMITELIHTINAQKPGWPLAVKSIIYRLIFTVYSSGGFLEGEVAPSSGIDKIKKSITYIEEHIGQNISVTDMACSAGLSIYHYIRLFKKCMGTTPADYFIHLRLEYKFVLPHPRHVHYTDGLRMRF